MRKLLLASIMLVWGSIAFAQEKTVSGKVTSSEDGSPLPGVSVLIKGSTKGVTTDGSGVYKISTSGNVSLSFSFIGFNWCIVIKINVGTITKAIPGCKRWSGFDFKSNITVIIGIIKRKVDIFEYKFYFVPI